MSTEAEERYHQQLAACDAECAKLLKRVVELDLLAAGRLADLDDADYRARGLEKRIAEVEGQRAFEQTANIGAEQEIDRLRKRVTELGAQLLLIPPKFAPTVTTTAELIAEAEKIDVENAKLREELRAVENEAQTQSTAHYECVERLMRERDALLDWAMCSDKDR